MCWVDSVNNDNGSLYTGATQLNVGDRVQIEGENRYRIVTYVMGSNRNGWRACFGRLGGVSQGAVPEGNVQWRVVRPEDEQIDAVLPQEQVTPQRAPDPTPNAVTLHGPETNSRLMSTKLMLEILLALVGVVGGIIALARAFR
jgi:hypothetical protein